MTGYLSDDELEQVEDIAHAPPRCHEAERLEDQARALEPGQRLRAELLRQEVLRRTALRTRLSRRSRVQRW
jgi:hypothetical protein